MANGNKDSKVKISEGTWNKLLEVLELDDTATEYDVLEAVILLRSSELFDISTLFNKVKNFGLGL